MLQILVLYSFSMENARRTSMTTKETIADIDNAVIMSKDIQIAKLKNRIKELNAKVYSQNEYIAKEIRMFRDAQRQIEVISRYETQVGIANAKLELKEWVAYVTAMAIQKAEEKMEKKK